MGVTVRRAAWNRAFVVLGGLALPVLAAILIWAPEAAHGEVVGSAIWIGLGIVPILLVGAYVAHRSPDHPQATRLVLAGSSMAVGEVVAYTLTLGIADPLPWWWAPLDVLDQYMIMVTVAAIGSVFALYPHGTGEQPWHGRTVRAMWWTAALLPILLLLTNDRLVVSAWLAADEIRPDNPLALAWLSWLGPPLDALFQTSVLVLVGLVVLAARYVRAGPDLRGRMRLLVFAMAIAVVGLFIDIAFQIAGMGTPSIVMVWYLVGSLMIPAIIMIGIARFRLFDIDLVVRRSVVYALLSLGIAAVYVVLAVIPGLAFGRRVPVELAVVITIAAALLFQPVRKWLNAKADRWVFGERVNRYRLLTDFGADLDRSVHLDELLPTLAATVARGLDAAWVRVRLRGDDRWLAEPVGLAGEPSGPAELVQMLDRGGETVGRIECGPAHEPYTDADRELLATLAGQAATAISNARLTAQSADRLVELGRSRARIVSAQDAERRRIERDIHDGVQQDVVALILKMGLARSQVARGETAPAAAIDELQADARELLGDLRELSQGIRPAVLSDRGLVAAVEARVAKLPLAVHLRADRELRARRYGADIEAAAFFLVCEALTNAAKHSGATCVRVELSEDDHSLTVSVHDDGAGFAPVDGAGMGLVNLRDRVEALGGTLAVTGRAGVGTDVLARLPLTGATS